MNFLLGSTRSSSTIRYGFPAARHATAKSSPPMIELHSSVPCCRQPLDYWGWTHQIRCLYSAKDKKLALSPLLAWWQCWYSCTSKPLSERSLSSTLLVSWYIYIYRLMMIDVTKYSNGPYKMLSIAHAAPSLRLRVRPAHSVAVGRTTCFPDTCFTPDEMPQSASTNMRVRSKAAREQGWRTTLDKSKRPHMAM